ncbi:unnamed protein product [Cuscuta campestris]|uniref:Fatty acyl-CoA reductase n=1 Tax=Cuscuta campestris TaxID=132261 RepID=A0A484LC34_9ASTE|nr:unnamed protein product [Cuscuta campestris]
MEALFLSVSSSSIVRRSNSCFLIRKHDVCRMQSAALRVRNMVHSQGGSGNNVVKSSNISYVVTERSATLEQGSKAALMESTAGSLILAPNGNVQTDVGMKDLVPYDGGSSSTALVEKHDDGIGIVKFLRGKSFLITGGTGFLGKVKFATQCQKLKLFLHVSTAYVNGQRQGRIMERPFCIGDSIAGERAGNGIHQNSIPKLNVEDEMKMVLGVKETLQESEMFHKMKELGLERAKKFGWQDTYVFTKAMGEMMIDDLKGDIPVVIIRPSVIESTHKEPFPGWMEGNRMMDPIILHYGKGQLTGFLVDPNGVLDVVPADMVVNATLAAMAKHGIAGKPGTNIYHIASSVVNPLVFKDLARLLYEHFHSKPYIDSKGKPIDVPTMKLFSSMEALSSHLWRDTINKSGLTMLGNTNGKLSSKIQNVCRKSVEQAKYLASIYEPYTFYGGRFDNSNSQKLMECMSKDERWQFGFDVESLDWKHYISNVHIPGLRRHVMKGRGSLCG